MARSMRRSPPCILLVILYVGLIGPAPVLGQAAGVEDVPPEPGAGLRVWLITVGPGDAIWERFGHNAIRVLDTATGRDVSYNWGIFDFQQVDFIPRFLQGRMLYRMVPFQTGPMIESYGGAGRQVVMQELALSPVQKVALRDLAERNALPENRDYLYQYFLDNCSTRVRDLLDLVLGGQLAGRFSEQATGVSYRFHTQRLTSVDPIMYAGIDLLLGTPTDVALTTWDEMFLPVKLRDAVRRLSITGPAGEERPLVISEETLAESTQRSDPIAPPGWFVYYALAGLLLAGILATGGLLSVRATPTLRRATAAVGVLWSLVSGVLGTILVLLLFTDHRFAWWNENLFLFMPLSLVLTVLVPLSVLGEKWRRRAQAVAILIAGLAVLGLLIQILPAARQPNAPLLALALPPHLSLVFALRRLTPTPASPPARDEK